MFSILFTEILAFSEKMETDLKSSLLNLDSREQSPTMLGYIWFCFLNLKLQGHHQDTVLKIFLQVTDPLVTNMGSKQEAFKAEKLQTSAAISRIENKTRQNKK